MIELNRRGATRRVFLTRRYAFKVPTWTSWRLFLNGLLANQQEAVFWHGLQTPEARKLMCPVLFSIPGGWLVVMPRCRPISPRAFLAYPWAKFFNNHGIPVEDKLDSFGRYKRNMVAVDYGS